MLIIGIIEELSQQKGNKERSNATDILSYFLCQETDSRLNNATAILRGMIYLLTIQQPFLVSHLRNKYDHTGRRLFEDTGAFHSLSEVLKEMLKDPRLSMAYLVVDALDECVVDLPPLLSLIAETTSTQSSRVKWVVSSRNRNDVEQTLGRDDHYTRLSLELNADHILRAVEVYIDHKISQIIAIRRNKVLQEQVREELRDKSDGTFLWVALVVAELQKSQLQRDVSRVLKRIPKGLTPFYDRMMQQVQRLEDDYPQLCRLLLSIATLVYRPLHMLEMRTLAGLEEEISDLEDLERIINMCSSFLTIRDNFIYFIHQSAKNYLTDASTMVFPTGPSQIHYDMFSRSLNALSNTLRQDIYSLKDFGPMTKDVRPDPDPLAPIRYSCVFWLNHFCEVNSQTPQYSQEVTESGKIYTFLIKHLLHWLESLSLIHEISGGILSIRTLLHGVQVCWCW